MKKHYRLHLPALCEYFLRTNNSNMETVAEFIDGSITSVMLVLRRGRVLRTPASYAEGHGEENNYPD
jgi:hypothetical protein